MNFSLLRLRLAATAAVLAVVGILVQPLLEPAGAEQSTAKAFAAARDHQARWFAADWAEIIGYTAAAFAIVTLVGLVRGRGVWLTEIGGWLSTAALLAIGLNCLSIAQGVLARQPDQAAMIRAYDQINSSSALLPFLVLALSSLFGPIVLAFGVWRAGLTGWWLPVLAVAGAVFFVVTGGGDNGGIVAALVQVPLCVQLATYAVLLVRRIGREASMTAGPAAMTAVPIGGATV